ncbi:MAG: tRNA pseudouridine(54/55) synthase Pus10, partial [Candidatus Thorarchaeota archaeon]
MIGSVTKEPLELALRVLETHSLCDHCLGRQFGWLGTAMTNEERGRSMKLVLTLRADYKLRSGETAAGSQILRTLAGNGMFAPARELSRRNAIEFPAITECHICTISGISIFLRLQDMVTKCVDSLRGIEFDNFLVGSIPPPALAEREDELKASFGLIHGETLRSHINRELGKRLGEVINKPVEFRRPHVVLVYDVQNDSVNVQISPLFVSGRYRKLQRGIPQSRWDCKACRGKGCDECGHTGRRYPDSISEYIGEPIREASSGTSFKFHAAGRE